MKAINITLKTLSPLLMASGESSAHIDADVRYDKYGFPYLQGKTFKGLLKESVKEVCEIGGYDMKIVETWFGKEGNQSGVLWFQNFYPENYETLKKALKDNPNALTKADLQTQFTETRTQTTIDKGTGTAKDTSLRKYRMISEGKVFETTILVPDGFADTTEGVLKKAIDNLRYMGTRRNRGFGKVKLTWDGKVENEDMENQANKKLVFPSEDATFKLSFTLTTDSPLIIANVIGEQNTVSTEHFIPAQTIRGLVAKLVMLNFKEEEKSKNAHEVNTFKDLILNGKVKYNPAFLQDFQPIPRMYAYDKTLPDDKSLTENGKEKYNQVFNVFTSPEALKGFGNAFINQANEKKGINTASHFHSSRPNRTAGRSTEEDGAIFYYEAIEEGQTFKTEILGSVDDLKEIYKLLYTKGNIHRLGKAKTAQYAQVILDNFAITPVEAPKIEKETYLVFQTPVITYNDYGMAVPCKKELEKAIKYHIPDAQIENIAAVSTQVETFMSVWSAKTPRETAFEMGTTLQLTASLTEEDWAKLLAKLETEGIGERKNEGYGRVKVVQTITEIVRNAKPPEQKDKGNDLDKLATFTEQKEKDLTLSKLKQRAIKDAENYKGKVSNSLISRLKNYLQATKNMDKLKQFIQTMEGKKANKTLEEAKHEGKSLWDTLRNSNETPDYWLTFFKALRIKNTHHQRQKEYGN